MTRNDFLKICGIVGVAFPFSSFRYDHVGNSSSSHRVVIVGAGAAGLTAAYLLKQSGIDFIILEASSEYGGRMKIDTTFSDFPIALGAEWISTNNINFSPFVDSSNIARKIKTANYLPTDEYWLKSGNKLLQGTLNTFNDKKFVNSSWFSVFEAFVLPFVNKHIKYQKKVKAISYSGETISVQCENERYKAQKVILTTPLPLLNQIDFSPALPAKKLDAISQVEYWNGFKAFFDFKEKFYPSFVDYLIQPATAGQVSLYDAAWGQQSDKNILGLFSVGAPANEYSAWSDDEFKRNILKELDKIFEGKASQNYIKHITQNWEKAPFAKGAYVSDYTEPQMISRLQETMEHKIYFAGDAYTDGSDWGNVHNAVQSAKQCVKSLIKEL